MERPHGTVSESGGEGFAPPDGGEWGAPDAGRCGMSLTWDLFMFLIGFVSGGLTLLAGLWVARTRRESLGEGDRFLAKLGSVAAQRFLEAVQD